MGLRRSWRLAAILLLLSIALSGGTTYAGATRPDEARDHAAGRYAIAQADVLAKPADPLPPDPVTSDATPQPGPRTYVVQPGDNLTMLAQNFGSTREAIAAANGISPNDFLYIGQVLTIPSANYTPAPTSTSTVAATATPTATATRTATPGATTEPGKTIEYTVQRGDNLSSIAVKFNTTLESLIDLNGFLDGNFLEVGQVLKVTPGNRPTQPTRTPPDEPVIPMGKYGPKWIDVNLSTQTMIAFEGQTPVLATFVSSGRGQTPTVLGTYRVYLKYKSQTMRGNILGEQYEVPNVPNVMYFYSGYALHGAYWHNNFGRPMSHGCVNLPLGIAARMYDWAPIGTIVVSHR